MSVISSQEQIDGAEDRLTLILLEYRDNGKVERVTECSLNNVTEGAKIR